MLGLARPACYGPAGATLTWAFVVERAKEWSGRRSGAGEGNRTLMTSLEGWGSAIELRPHIWRGDEIPAR
jgi:hypothetical protein